MRIRLRLGGGVLGPLDHAAVALLDGVLVQEGFELAYLGLGISAAAATMSTRRFRVRQGGELKSAFELGRDIGRAETEAEVRSCASSAA